MRISFSDRKTGWVLLIAGFILSGFFSFDLYDNFKYLQRAVEGFGKIVSIEPIDAGGRKIQSLVEVQFLTRDSRLYDVKLPDFVFDQFSYRRLPSVGQLVTFLYDPNNPKEVRSLQVSDQYPGSDIFFIMVGIIPIFFGLRILKKATNGIY